MSNVVKLASSREHKATRACNTCRHAPRNTATTFARCKATGDYISTERWISHGACGRDGKLWEPKPPKRGIIGTLKIWIWGEA